jgi:hypothetical protein
MLIDPSPAWGWADDSRFLDLSKVDPSEMKPKKNNKL